MMRSRASLAPTAVSLMFWASPAFPRQLSAVLLSRFAPRWLFTSVVLFTRSSITAKVHPFFSRRRCLPRLTAVVLACLPLLISPFRSFP